MKEFAFDNISFGWHNERDSWESVDGAENTDVKLYITFLNKYFS